jgi:hypothetical protein
LNFAATVEREIWIVWDFSELVFWVWYDRRLWCFVVLLSAAAAAAAVVES